MIKRKPENHLFSVTYKFNQREMQAIIEEFVFKKTGIPNVYFSLGIDDDDNQARIIFDFDDIDDDIWAVLMEKIPNIEEDYSLPPYILGEYMHADIYDVRGYYYYPSRDNENEINFYVEANQKNYIEHVSIHEWGF